MTRFWQVEYHHFTVPTALLADSPRWTGVERLAKCGAVVGKAYSEALRVGDIVEARTSWARFVLRPTVTAFDPGTEPMTADLGMGEVHEVPPPPLAWLQLPDQERRRHALEHLHGLLLELGAARGWPLEPFEAARARVLAGGIAFSVTSTPKSSPDRRHRAQLSMELDGEGDAWMTLAVIDRDGDGNQVFGPFPTSESVRNFNAAKRTLKWLSAEEVSVTPWPVEPPSGLDRAHTFRL
jgi:hypothetical protein